ncbi:hypothetical protein [Oceanibium sediminis]|uniref:hypothetical protein n=1 Tax=Oceanibium sediminis TaxID=2026339 RepID=UPI001E55374D|nr:hypothetical protein [Oceanibium sediminis]
MKLIDLTDPFFRPRWVRAAVVGVAIAWGLFEFATGAPFWGVFFVGLGAVTAWRFATIDYGAPD